MINSEMEHSWIQEGNILLRDDERIDDLQRNHYGIIQRKGTFCFGMDAVLLSGFAVVKPGEKALDLGTGTGIIPILLEAKTEGRHFTGLGRVCGYGQEKCEIQSPGRKGGDRNRRYQGGRKQVCTGFF